MFKRKQRLSVVAYGDSWTYGSVADGWHEARSADGDPEKIYGSWAQQLKRYLHHNNPDAIFCNKGVPGWTSKLGADSFEQMVLECAPDCIVLNFGINDWKSCVPLEQYRDAMERMIIHSKQSGCLCVLWTSGPLSICSGETYGWHSPVDDSDFPHRYTEFTETIRELAQKHQLMIADAERDIIELWKSCIVLTDWFYDSHHFTQAGHDAIFKSLKNTLAICL